MRTIAAAAFGLVAACASPRTMPAPARAAPAVATVASVAPPAVAPTDAGAPAAPVVVDLLHWTRAAVDVPSKVANPRDYPEHLVDGKPETAWNGKTGALDADIAFGVPEEAWIDRIELNAGFDSTGPKGDLFTMNHRITKVAVFALSRRDASPNDKNRIAEVALDPNERRPQRIPIKRQGGSFLIRVLDTVPGTKKEWKELVISELLVMGDPKSARLPKAQMPTVTIASRELTEAPKESVPNKSGPTDLDDLLPLAGRSTADLCGPYHLAAAKSFGVSTSVDRYPGPPVGPFCAPAKTARIALSTPKLKAVSAVTLHFARTIEDYLLLETDQGFVVPRDASIRWQNRDYDITKVDSKIARARFEEPSLAIVTLETVEHVEAYCGVGGDSSPTYQATSYIDFDLRCDLATKPVACTRVERRRECIGPDCH